LGEFKDTHVFANAFQKRPTIDGIFNGIGAQDEHMLGITQSVPRFGTISARDQCFNEGEFGERVSRPKNPRDARRRQCSFGSARRFDPLTLTQKYGSFERSRPPVEMASTWPRSACFFEFFAGDFDFTPIEQRFDQNEQCSLAVKRFALARAMYDGFPSVRFRDGGFSMGEAQNGEMISSDQLRQRKVFRDRPIENRCEALIGFIERTEFDEIHGDECGALPFERLVADLLEMTLSGAIGGEGSEWILLAPSRKRAARMFDTACDGGLFVHERATRFPHSREEWFGRITTS
jgi:hypothetical protein